MCVETPLLPSPSGCATYTYFIITISNVEKFIDDLIYMF
jgi:hypothetical protein